jgi:hypothetical protein
MEPKLRPGVREIRLAVDDVDFDAIVNTLRNVLTIREFEGFPGCDPCRSGLDRVIIEDPAWSRVSRLQFEG